MTVASFGVRGSHYDWLIDAVCEGPHQCTPGGDLAVRSPQGHTGAIPSLQPLSSRWGERQTNRRRVIMKEIACGVIAA